MAPEGWRQVHLSEVADQRTEKTVPTKGDIRPYVALEHLAQGSPTLLGWSEAGAALSAKTVFRAGDVLYGKLRPYLRKAAAAPFDGLCSTDILPLFGSPLLDGRYLVQIAQWSPLQQHAVCDLNRHEDAENKLEAPWAIHDSASASPRATATMLSSVDEAIQKTQAVVEQVEVVKRGLMQELLTRGVPGRHTRFKQTQIGELPAEWKALPIHTLCNVVRGSTPRPARDPRYFNGDYVPWITVGEVTKDGWPYLLKTRTGLTEKGARFSRYLKPGTVILTNSGVTLGIPKLLKIGGCANDGIAAFQDVSESLGPHFFYYVLSAMTDVFQTKVARGVGQPNLNTSLIGSTLIPVPNRLEQDEIAEVLLGSDQRIAAESDCVSELRVLKNALMSALLTGELRVAPETEAA